LYNLIEAQSPVMGELSDERKFRVLFCGRDMHFSWAFTKEEMCVVNDVIEVIQCDRDDVPAQLPSADVVVPLMSPLPPEYLDRAPHLKLIIQYGAGVEGVDIPAATKRGIHVCNIPTSLTPNAASCAEMAIMLVLMCLRNSYEMAQRSVGIRLALGFLVLFRQEPHVLQLVQEGVTRGTASQLSKR
jgi:hypothetical protein